MYYAQSVFQPRDIKYSDTGSGIFKITGIEKGALKHHKSLVLEAENAPGLERSPGRCTAGAGL